MKRSSDSVFRDICQLPYSRQTNSKLYSSCKGSKDMLQRMTLLKSMPVHRGCVNTLCWNSSGDCILSGSDDQRLVVTNCFNYKVVAEHKTSHRANIFSAKYLSDNYDKNVVSCSGDGIILFTDMSRAGETQSNQFNCHYGTTYEVQTLPGDPHTFLSCGEDGTVRWYDLRQKTSCVKPDCKEDIMISCQGAVTALSVSPLRPYQLAIGCSDSTVRIFDRRTLGTRASGGPTQEGSLRPLCSFCAPELDNISYRITSLKFSPEGDDVLVSYSSDYLYLFSIKNLSSIQMRCNSPPIEAPRKSGPRVAPPVKRLRLRGDWSDTGPNARPEREGGRRGEPIAQVRPTLQATLMQRMTDVLARMLNDPATRAALSGASEESHAAQNSPPPAVGIDEDEGEVGIEVGALGVEQIGVGGGVVVEAEERIEDASAAVVIADTSGIAANSYSPPPLSNLSLHASSQQLEVAATETAVDLSSQQAAEASTSDTQRGNTSETGPPIYISSLQGRLSCMRDGFIEKHHSEPAVSLSLSDVGSSAGTISLGIGNEINRDMAQAQPIPANTQHEVDFSQPSTSQPQASSSGMQDQIPIQHDVGDGNEDYGDSEDEDLEDEEMSAPQLSMGSRRTSHPIEDHMEKAMAAIRGESKESFEEPTTPKPVVKQKYTGHRNARTMIKEASFWGSNYVMSGSDCGHVFVWDRESGELVMLLEADKHVVNCLQPHPYLPLLATSGIDYDVKLWAPLGEDPNFDPGMAEVLTKRNEIMLEETRDTITVPASFMIRMLACLNQIRRGGRTRSRNSRRPDGDDM